MPYPESHIGHLDTCVFKMFPESAALAQEPHSRNQDFIETLHVRG